MNTVNKYFIPSIEDIRIEYKCETSANNEKVWKPLIVKKNNILETICALENGFIKTPFLTKQDIINEGWEQRGDDSYFYNKEFLSIYNYLTNILIVISLKEDVLFKGYCPSINEFRTIIKLLKIK